MDEEDVLTRHRREKKDLQARVTALRKKILKNDKKTKKEVMDEINQLDSEMKQRHEKELDEFHRTCFGSGGKSGESDEILAIEKLTVGNNEDEEEGGEEGSQFYQVRKISKAQRKRDKKTQKEKEKAEQIEAESKDLYENSAKKWEKDRFEAILGELGFTLHDIPSDGDCMFKALEHQLSLQGRSTSVQELRSRCASELRKRREEFLPFLTNPDTDEIMDDRRYNIYCDKMEKTKCWGGNIELQALSHALSLPIKVIQATGPSIDIGSENLVSDKSKTPLTISYHRHAYQLGEHYNSLIPIGSKPH